jgi:hypothetical protein
MTLKGIRYNGETYVKVTDVIQMLRKDALFFVTRTGGVNALCNATATGISMEADKLEEAFATWKYKPDNVIKKRTA